MTEDNLLSALQWRYATKKFNSDKKIPEDILQKILESCNLTPTSLGLQPYKMVLVEDKSLIQSLGDITFQQENVLTCNHLLVLCAEENVDDKFVESYIDFMAKERNVSRSLLNGYEQMCKNFIHGLSPDKKREWIAHQIYIVLGNLMTTCAILGIDSCPMEGFNPEKLDQVLNLNAHQLRSVLIIPLGNRAEEDTYANLDKVRRPLDFMVKNLKDLK